jgi:DNA-binding transcriptional LysR family regulator
MEELAHMVTFARVVKAGSFAAAARHLNVAASVASKHVSKLEQSLGVRLLNRSTRKLSLTEAGTAYYEHCARIVEEVDKSRRTLAALQKAPRGRLRVTAPIPVANLLGPMLRQFLTRYRQIQLDLDASNRVVDLAEEGFDVAIRAARTLPPNVVARELSPIRMQLCASPKYLQQEGVPRHPRELSRHDCVIAPVTMPDGIWHFRRGKDRVEVAVKGSMQSNTVEALRDLVVGGTGLTLLPSQIIEKDLRAGRLTALLEDWEIEPRVNLYVVYLPTRHMAPKLRVFIDFLAEKFAPSKAGHPNWFSAQRFDRVHR